MLILIEANKSNRLCIFFTIIVNITFILIHPALKSHFRYRHILFCNSCKGSKGSHRSWPYLQHCFCCFEIRKRWLCIRARDRQCMPDDIQSTELCTCLSIFHFIHKLCSVVVLILCIHYNFVCKIQLKHTLLKDCSSSSPTCFQWL